MRRTPSAVIVLTVATLTLSGCAGTSTPGGAATTQAPLTVTGSVKAQGFTPTAIAREGEICYPGNGYEDLPGAQVVVADDTGKTLATGEVADGKFISTQEGSGDSSNHPCSFAFTVAKVPGGLAFYTVTIGRRGAQKVTGAEIAKPLNLTLR